MTTGGLWVRRGHALAVLLALAFGLGLGLGLAGSHAAWAATPAGVAISNIASLTYKADGSVYGAASNPVAIAVGEIIDFSVVPLGDLKVMPGALNQGVAFRLSNLGNARRAFVLALDPAQAGDSFDPTACRIYVQRANLEKPDSPLIEAYGRGDALFLADGETVTVWAMCDIPATAGGIGRVVLTARPLLTSNDDGVPLWTSDRATASSAYRVAEGLSAELIKSQSVVDALGRPRAIKGAIVTYSLAAKLEGEGVARDLAIRDPIPAGSTYVPGSLRLDGERLTDGDDADQGLAGAEGVLVRLGDVTAPALRTVTFQVLINP